MVARRLMSHFSIIAVHGIQGDWEKTWEADGKIWLRDFLGRKIDKVQVLSFGYNSCSSAQVGHMSSKTIQLSFFKLSKIMWTLNKYLVCISGVTSANSPVEEVSSHHFFGS